ncbi:hypothetical protein DGG96_01300 [Legionella qingyii]|uniref:Uncharacterized protein n=1 Tax=Legionella qingyii TaxID=2184757 RepID=A0A317UAB6_9GAMM|nr:hypothetical protein DGG96_01300 [Legionella qingyii]
MLLMDVATVLVHFGKKRESTNLAKQNVLFIKKLSWQVVISIEKMERSHVLTVQPLTFLQVCNLRGRRVYYYNVK